MQVFPQFKYFWDKKILCKVGQCKTASAKSKPIVQNRRIFTSFSPQKNGLVSTLHWPFCTDQLCTGSFCPRNIWIEEKLALTVFLYWHILYQIILNWCNLHSTTLHWFYTCTNCLFALAYFAFIVILHWVVLHWLRLHLYYSCTALSQACIASTANSARFITKCNTSQCKKSTGARGASWCSRCFFGTPH